tara:strand:+ start:118 stop:894 length:777 start_codon:yes stop_codon:yes gene_type:complete
MQSINNLSDFKALKEFASKRVPEVQIQYHKNFYRHDVLKYLTRKNCIGIELGVAQGHFSKRMIESGKFKKFYGVDLYEDHHDTNEYIKALNLIGIEEDYVILRMSFDEAKDLFDDNYFDFIYFDGYAHTGEEGGKTLNDWYKKLKIGGIYAGDDYHEDWPLVKWAVNDMVSQLNYKLNVTGIVENNNLNRYPSWFFKKENEGIFSTNEQLKELGTLIRNNTRTQINNKFNLTINSLKQILLQVKSQQPSIAEDLKKIL